MSCITATIVHYNQSNVTAKQNHYQRYLLKNGKSEIRMLRVFFINKTA